MKNRENREEQERLKYERKVARFERYYEWVILAVGLLVGALMGMLSLYITLWLNQGGK